MTPDLLATLHCPACREPLRAEPGRLICPCGKSYPIVRGIPRLAGLPDQAPLDPRQARSQESFGHEWTARYPRLGYDDKEQEAFLEYTRALPSDFKERLALDAGCGNGRYANLAARWGARVVGVDISDSVEVAADNLKDRPTVLIAQADLFKLPFKDDTFDLVYCLGVLHHTPDPPRGFAELRRVLKPGGTLSVFVYGKGNPILYFTNRLLRSTLPRLPKPVIWYLCYLPTAVAKALRAIPLLGPALHWLLLHVVFFSDHHHNNFDAYSAGHTSFHTRDEVVGWFAGMDEVIFYGDGRHLKVRGTKR